MKILHFSDAHLRDSDIEESRKCLTFIVGKAMEERPDLVVFSGDIFHSRDVKLDSQAAKTAVLAFSTLADIAPVAVVLGTPTHDGKAPEILAMVRGRFPVHVSTVPEQIYLLDGKFTREMPEAPYEPEVILSMMPQPTKEHFSRVTQSSISESDQEVGGLLGAIFMGFGGMAAQWQKPHHILVGHFTVKGSVTSTGQTMIGREIEVSREQLELARADAVMLGHIHASQKIGRNIFYAGSIYRENWGEQEAKGFFLHKYYDGQSPAFESDFIETPTKKIAKVEHDYTTLKDADEASVLACFWSSMDEIKDASVRVELKVYQDEATKINKDEIESILKEGGAQEVEVKIIRVPRETVRSAEVTKATGLPEKVTILAKTRGEEVPEGVLAKAQDLEMMAPEQILERVGGAA